MAYIDLFSRMATQDYEKFDTIIANKESKYRIVTEQARYPLLNIENIFKKILLTPSYQRRRVWDATRRSRLIESFIINVPIPSIFLYEYEYSKYEVMDGLQRISTIIDFFNDKFPLSNLTIWSELNDKKFSELEKEIQEMITRRYISATILLNETTNNKIEAEQMKRFVFERLNTGGVELSPQEIRNAMYGSDFNKVLEEIATESSFRKFWGSFEEDEYKRMEDCELILRFFTYKSALKNSKNGTTRKLLDNYMEEAVNFTKEEARELKEYYEQILNIAKSVFGNKPFIKAKSNKKSEKMIYDAIMLACSELFDTERASLDYKDLSKEKYELIKGEKEIFNGKYTSLTNVNQRKEKILHLLKKGLIDEE